MSKRIKATHATYQAVYMQSISSGLRRLASPSIRIISHRGDAFRKILGDMRCQGICHSWQAHNAKWKPIDWQRRRSCKWAQNDNRDRDGLKNHCSSTDWIFDQCGGVNGIQSNAESDSPILWLRARVACIILGFCVFCVGDLSVRIEIRGDKLKATHASIEKAEHGFSISQTVAHQSANSLRCIEFIVIGQRICAILMTEKNVCIDFVSTF